MDTKTNVVQINRHKMTTVTRMWSLLSSDGIGAMLTIYIAAYHMEAYGVDDNRYDMRMYHLQQIFIALVFPTRLCHTNPPSP